MIVGRLGVEGGSRAQHRPPASLLRSSLLRSPRGPARRDPAWRACAQQAEAARNQPGGFWLAAAGPAAASEAITGPEPVGDLRCSREPY